MKTKIYSCLAILGMLSVACNNSSKSDPEFDYNQINKVDTAKNASPLLVPENKTESGIVPTAVTTNAITTNTSTGINPPHGQPGHRCDIGEGAPLNNKPAATPVQQAPPQIVTTNKTVTTNNPTTQAGINPAHGEPGHRCDIAVGAPLNSKPSTTAATTPITPLKQTASTTTKTVTAPGMNPPHGEPGHRCDIGVGTPLSQPVKPTIVNDSTKK